jgi:hypothetical protein
MTTAKPKLAYSIPEAAAAAGLSVASIRKAIDGKYLPQHYPPPIDRPVILVTDLANWLESGPSESPSRT